MGVTIEAMLDPWQVPFLGAAGRRTLAGKPPRPWQQAYYPLLQRNRSWALQRGICLTRSRRRMDRH